MNIYQLVRHDLLNRENNDIPPAYATGSAALLDAYESALDLVCQLRALIQDAQIGDGSFDTLYTENDAKIIALTQIRKAVP